MGARRRMIVCSLLFCAFAVPASAERTQLMIRGVGAASCGKWTELRKTNGPDTQMISWVFGFVTALNARTLSTDFDIGKGLDADALLHWIDAHCRANPLESLYTATESLARELRLQTGSR